MVNPVPLPQGFEMRVDNRTGKAYFIDHSSRKTQWTDPRLDHPSVWEGPNQYRSAILSSLRNICPSATENICRQALLETDFNATAAIQLLQQRGYRTNQPQPTAAPVASRPAVSPAAAQPPARPSPAVVAQQQRPPSSPAVRTPAAVVSGDDEDSDNSWSSEVELTRVTSRNVDDEFAMMQLKSQFPAVDDAFLKELLRGDGGGDAVKCAELLRSMGYEERDGESRRAREQAEQAQEERRRLMREREQQERIEAERNRTVARLQGDFPFAPTTMVMDVLNKFDFDYDRAKAMMQESVAKSDAKEKLIVQFPQIPKGVIERFVDSKKMAEVTVEQLAAQIQTSLDKPKEPPQTGESSRVNTMQRQISKTPSPTASRPKTSSAKPRRSIPEILMTERQGATSSRSVVERKTKTLAKGPDAQLCVGADPSRRSASLSARGADSSLRNGPDRSLLTCSNIKLVAM